MKNKGFMEKIGDFVGINKEPESVGDKLESLENDLYVARKMLEDADYRNEIEASNVSKEDFLKEDLKGQKRKRVSLRELQLLYLNNQFIYRGVNVRADEVTSRGYRIFGGDEEGRENCRNLMSASGGEQFFHQWSVNTDVCGDGYVYKVRSVDGKKILQLRHTNPITFGYLTDKNDKIILDNKSKFPKAFMQIRKSEDEGGQDQKKEIPLEDVAHLRFNTFADEFTGVSSLQPVYRTTMSLMNMERAAAESAVKTANPSWLVKTGSKSPRDVAQWAKMLNKISAKEVTFLPDGMEVELKSPGNQNFNAYASYFLDAVVAALGVPKSILTGASEAGGGNRSTVRELSRHFYSVIRLNQKKIERIMNDIFQEYADLAGFKAPTFEFNQIAEDADSSGQRAIDLYTSGIITLKEARQIIGLTTSKEVVDEIKDNPKDGPKKRASPDVKDDLKTWHNNTMSPQAGNKSKMKKDPTSEHN